MVCDGEGPSVWIGGPSGLARQEWPTGESLANLYSQAAELFTSAPGQEFQLEALARLGNGSDAERLSPLLAYRDGEVVADPEWRTVVGDWLSAGGTSISHRARVASAVQGQLGLLLLAMAADLRARTGQAHMAVGGGLFFNTWFTTLLRQAGVFDDVSVAINPGNAGLAAGAALWTSTGGHRPGNRVSPFLGPTFGAEEIKRTLDNCKLSYESLDENAVVDVAVHALRRGQLVGWFQGRMEWGHRALGHRSILASPLSPYVLDNLNSFLKHRQRHRTYGVSVPESRLADCFEGPPRSRYMEFEYRPRDTARFEALLPDGTSSLRVQSIPETPEPGASPRFRQLHEAFETAAGLPVLVNTSFNAFREPMVCSPRDAIRVFFGTGLDLLVMDRFVIRK
jgi:carbamoyltransferase